MKIKYPEGATPIEDFSGLLPRHITNKKQLDEWETVNILQTATKYFGGKRTFKINAEFLRKIHRDMFSQTWKWAGEFRKNDLNIGINWHSIPVEMKKLCDDVMFWKEKKSFDILEQSVRLHHRLVKIHPFVNGNGRHARFTADLFLHYHKHPLPEWPSDRLIKSTDVRKKYISSLIKADNGERTRVSYNIYGPGKVKIRVFSKNGVLIKELFNGNVDGKNDQEECSWDGRNTAGKTVASGTYIIIIETDSYTEKAKVAVIR